MFPCLDIECAIREIQRHAPAHRVAGLMIANYKAQRVRGALRRSYTEWEAEFGGDFALYWPGYGVCPDPAPSGGIPLDFSDGRYDDPPALRGGQDLKRVFDKLENPGRLYFDQAAFGRAKRFLHDKDILKRIEPLTLVLFRPIPGNTAPNETNTLCIRLLTGSEGDRTLEEVNTCVSELGHLCRHGADFARLKKAEKAWRKKEKKPAGSLISIGEFNLLKAGAGWTGLSIG